MKTTNKSGIYAIKNNVNSTVYIGSTISLSHRKGHHFFQLKNKVHANINLQNFYNEHGVESLYFEVLEFCGKEKLIEREQFYFSQFEYKFNIQMFAISSLGRVCSDEVKNKISKSLLNAGLKGRKKSEETKKAMRKPKSIEHREKIKIAQKNVIKKVFQYDLKLNLINTFESISLASKTLKIDFRDISANCNKRQKTARGFIFSFTKQNK